MKKTMAKENLKPVSTRLDPKTLEAIDKFVATRSYWKRNSVINQVLTAVFDNFTETEIYDMVRYRRRSNYTVEAKFEIKKSSI